MEAIFDQWFGIIRQFAQLTDFIPKLVILGMNIVGIKPQTAVDDRTAHNHRIVVHTVPKWKKQCNFLMSKGEGPNIAVLGN